MKLFRICGFFSLLLLLSTFSLAQAPKAKSSRTPAKTPDELREDCKKFVQDFFDWYLPKASGSAEKSESAEAVALKKRPEDFSRALRYALMGDANGSPSSKELLKLDGDPFLNCQECPRHVKYGDPRLMGYRCQVPLYFVQDGVPEGTAHVIPEAMYTQKRWVFVNFLDGEGGVDLMTTLKNVKNQPKPQ